MKKSTICKSKKADFLSFMQNQIQEKKMRNKIKTSANYQSSLRSFTHFLQTKGYCRSVSFESITEELIASYETYLQHERGITKNSSSFYIRTLHAAYKKGIAMLNLKLRDPFGNVYTGVDKTRKRAVNIDVIIKLMQYKKLNKSMEFSRDTFVFCFFAQGMPFIDFAKLKKENLQNTLFFRTFGRYIVLFFCLQTMRHMKFFFRSRGIFSFSYTELLFISVSTVHKLLIGRLTSFYECF